jgi:hypothetical protein
VPPTASLRADREKNTINPGLDTAIASLEVEELGCWDDDGIRYEESCKGTNSRALAVSLCEAYRVIECRISHPFLILCCEGGVPEPRRRPISIADCVAVWLNVGDGVPGGLSIGDFGNGIAADLRPFDLPKTQTLTRLVEYFLSYTYISFLKHQIFIEYSEGEDVAWYYRLQDLPRWLQTLGCH